MPRLSLNGKYFPISPCSKINMLGSVTTEGKPNDFVSELGQGVTLYFKLLRYLGLMFLLFTLLSVPSLVIFGMHG
jgi:hypothetical protein